MKNRYEAERALLTSLSWKYDSTSDGVLPIIDPKHINDHDIRDVIIRMKAGETTQDLMHTKHRDLIIGSSGIPDAQAWQMYRIVKEYWIEEELESLYLRSRTIEDPLQRLDFVRHGAETIENGITELRKADAAENFEKSIMSDVQYWPTRIPKLDRALGGGMYPTMKMIVAARPSMGKTALVAFIARLNVEAGTPVGFWSIESPNDQIMRRALCSRHNIVNTCMTREFLRPQELEMLIKSSYELQNEKGFAIHNSSGLSSQQIAAEMYSSPASICMVDHLQKFMGRPRRDVTTEAMQRMCDVANNKRKAVIIVSQLNREVDDVTEPSLSELAESGDIERDADVVLFLWSEQRDTGQEIMDINMTVAKRRDGKKSMIKMKFKRDTYEFYETDGIHQEPQTHF